MEEGIATATGLVNQLDKSAAETSAEIRQQIEARTHPPTHTHTDRNIHTTPHANLVADPLLCVQALESILRDRERQLLAEVEAVKEQKKRTLAAQREALEVALAAAKASAEYGTRVRSFLFHVYSGLSRHEHVFASTHTPTRYTPPPYLHTYTLHTYTYETYLHMHTYTYSHAYIRTLT